MTESPKPWTLMLAASLVVAILAVVKLRSDDFRRPLGEDELITVRVYTGAGTHGDGTPRALVRREQLEALPPLTGSQLGVGAYASFGRWAEPNNHVVHSAAVNLFLGLVHPVEAAVRLPALLAATGFGLALAWLCIACGRGWGAPVAAALGMAWPYVSWYSAESRGYALMMLFVVLFVLAARWVLTRPSSVIAGATLAGVSVLTVMNLVNLSADWIAPAFAVLYLRPRWVCPELQDIAAARKSLLVVALATATILGVFLMDRLPYLVSAMRQYGVPYQGFGGYVRYVLEAMEYLFPDTLWKTVGLVGLIGAWVAAKHPQTRGVLALGAAALAASALHFAVAGKFPYLRNFGYLLPPAMFGVAVLADRAVRLLPVVGLRWGSMLVLTAAVALAERVDPPADPDPQYAAFATALAETPTDGAPGRVMLDRGVRSSLDLYYPAGWQPVETPFPTSGSVDIVRIEKSGGEYAVRRERYAVAGPGSADRVVWHPPFEATSVTPEPVLNELRRAGATTVQPFHGRYHAKLEVLSRVTVILADGSDEAAIRTVAGRHGGAVIRLREMP